MHAAAPREFNVMAVEHSTVYATISGRPPLNLKEPPGRQLEAVLAYGEASNTLSKWWNEHVDAFREVVKDA